ncbi:hypothetical protein Slin14017_G122390 [Septoria linicola]|nr:hypothetical protein Slin14017_G122390 [Septoria linicola]
MPEASSHMPSSERATEDDQTSQQAGGHESYDELYGLTPEFSGREQHLTLPKGLERTPDAAAVEGTNMFTHSCGARLDGHFQDMPSDAEVRDGQMSEHRNSQCGPAGLKRRHSSPADRRGAPGISVTHNKVGDPFGQDFVGPRLPKMPSKSTCMHNGDRQAKAANYDALIKHEGSMNVELSDNSIVGHARSIHRDKVQTSPSKVSQAACSSPILIHLPRTASDPRRLFFVFNMSNEDLTTRPSTTQHMLDVACRQAYADRAVLECTEHDERLFSVVFKSARQARKMEGTQIMLNGSLIGAEFCPPNRPCNFFWTGNAVDLSDGEVVSAVSSAFPDLQWRPLLYKQSNETVLEYVLFFQPCPGLLRLCLQIRRGEGETMKLWFRPKVPRSQCRRCYETHPARCYRRAKRLL